MKIPKNILSNNEHCEKISTQILLKIKKIAWSLFKTQEFCRVKLVKTAEINSVIAVTGFFRYLLNKKHRRSPFFRCSSEFRYLGFRYSSRYLYADK